MRVNHRIPTADRLCSHSPSQISTARHVAWDHWNARPLSSPLPPSASGMLFIDTGEPCHDSNIGRPNIVAERKPSLGR